MAIDFFVDVAGGLDDAHNEVDGGGGGSLLADAGGEAALPESCVSGLGGAFDNGGFAVQSLRFDLLAMMGFIFEFREGVYAIPEEVLGQFIGEYFSFSFGGGILAIVNLQFSEGGAHIKSKLHNK